MEFESDIPTDPALLEFIEEQELLSFHQSFPTSDDFAAEAEAINCLEIERVEKLIAKREVIIHPIDFDRIRNWRSSSIPLPETPTRPPCKSADEKRPTRSALPVLPSSPPRLSYQGLFPAASSSPGVVPVPRTPQYQAVSACRKQSTDIAHSSPTLTTNMDPFEEVSDDENEQMQTGTSIGSLNFKPYPNKDNAVLPAAGVVFNAGSTRDPLENVFINGTTKTIQTTILSSAVNAGGTNGTKEVTSGSISRPQGAAPFEESDGEDEQMADMPSLSQFGSTPFDLGTQKRPLEDSQDIGSLPPRKRVNVTPPPTRRTELETRFSPRTTNLTSQVIESLPPPAQSRKVSRSLELRSCDGKTFTTVQYARSDRISAPRILQEKASIAGQKSFYGVDIHHLMQEAQNQIAMEARKVYEARDVSSNDIGITDPAKHAAKPGPTQVGMLWTEKYRAKRFTELVGDERTHRQVMRWLKSWDPVVFPSARPSLKKHSVEGEYRRKKILLIAGPPGLGKTTLAHVAARQAGYEPAEINASEARNKDVVNNKLRDMISNEGVSIGSKKKGGHRPVCLVVDEIDGVEGNAESGFTGALVNLLALDAKNEDASASSGTKLKKRGSKKADNFRLWRPIIAVCNDLYAPCLRALRPLCEIVYMNKPPTNAIANRMKDVFEREGIQAETDAVRRLVELACGGEGGKGGGSGGDLRGALVSGEWIATRLRNSMKYKDGKSVRLTRQLVDEEMGGGYGGVDGSGKGKGGVREVVEKVFAPEKTIRSRREATRKGWQMEDLKNTLETCGEFDSVMNGCFASYPERPYHDDNFLTKPCAASEWLYFHDLMSFRVWDKQDFELTPYLSYPILGFRNLFASSMAMSMGMGHAKPKFGEQEEEVEEVPFSGPRAEYEAREKLKENKTILQSLQNGLLNVRTLQSFKKEVALTTELAPYLSRILSPRIQPVLIQQAEGRLASVRKESERKLVKRSAEIMISLGLRFEKVKIDIGNGRTDFAFRMEPPIDALNDYKTLTATSDGDAPQPVRYAVRQVIHQECEKELLLQAQLRRQARGLIGADALPQAKGASSALADILKNQQRNVKRDFFGRIIEEAPCSTNCPASAKDDSKVKIWVTFNEGASNAVRRNIGLEELVRTFY